MWDDGITRIAEASKKIHEQLGQTLKNYRTADDEMAKGFSGT